MASTVLNSFAQADANGDNTLTLGGTVLSANGHSIKKETDVLRLPNVANSGENDSLPITVTGTITLITCIIDATVDFDTVLTLNINGTPVTNGLVTLVAAGSAPNSIFSATPTALNVVVPGDYIEITSDGGATGGVEVNTKVEIEVN